MVALSVCMRLICWVENNKLHFLNFCVDYIKMTSQRQ